MSERRKFVDCKRKMADKYVAEMVHRTRSLVPRSDFLDYAKNIRVYVNAVPSKHNYSSTAYETIIQF